MVVVPYSKDSMGWFQFYLQAGAYNIPSLGNAVSPATDSD